MPTKPADTTQSGQPQSASQSSSSGAGQSGAPSVAERDPDDHMNPRMPSADPSSPAENQQNTQAAKQARAAADQQTLAKLQGIYVDVRPVTVDGSVFPWEGICLRCGFHTLELTQDAAKAIVNSHMAIHWRDAVSGIQMQGGIALAGSIPTADLRMEAMQAQQKGAQQGGQAALKPVQQKEQQQEQKAQQIVQQLSASSSSGSGAAGSTSTTPPSQHGG